MKYYYTSPIEAMYMAREFGFKYVNDEGWYLASLCRDSENETYAIQVFLGITCNGYCDVEFDHQERYYIHPDYHDMLKPQGDDSVSYNDCPHYVLTNDTCPQAFPKLKENEVALNDLSWSTDIIITEIKEVEIMRRNGKAWFTPEVEDDSIS